MKKIRQIEGRSVLHSQNVNKLWRLFLESRNLDIKTTGEISIDNLLIRFVILCDVIIERIIIQLLSIHAFDSSSVSRLSPHTHDCVKNPGQKKSLCHRHSENGKHLKTSDALVFWCRSWPCLQLSKRREESESGPSREEAQQRFSSHFMGPLAEVREGFRNTTQ